LACGPEVGRPAKSSASITAFGCAGRGRRYWQLGPGCQRGASCAGERDACERAVVRAVAERVKAGAGARARVGCWAGLGERERGVRLGWEAADWAGTGG